MIKLLDDLEIFEHFEKTEPYFSAFFSATAAVLINDPDLLSIWAEYDEHGVPHSMLYANTDSLLLFTDGNPPGAEMLLFVTNIASGGGIENIDCDDVSFPILKKLFPKAEIEEAVQMVCENPIPMPERNFEIRINDNANDVSAVLSKAFGEKDAASLDFWYLRTKRGILRGQNTLVTLYQDGKAVSTASIRGRTKTSGAITSVVTLPEYRGRGYASYLTALCSNMLLDEHRTPWLVPANPGVQKMYEKLGYKAVKNYNCLHFSEKEETK